MHTYSALSSYRRWQHRHVGNIVSTFQHSWSIYDRLGLIIHIIRITQQRLGKRSNRICAQKLNESPLSWMRRKLDEIRLRFEIENSSPKKCNPTKSVPNTIRCWFPLFFRFKILRKFRDHGWSVIVDGVAMEPFMQLFPWIIIVFQLIIIIIIGTTIHSWCSALLLSLAPNQQSRALNEKNVLFSFGSLDCVLGVSLIAFNSIDIRK